MCSIITPAVACTSRLSPPPSRWRAIASPRGRRAPGRGADVVVDGILGTGTSANPALRGGARDVVEAILPV